MCNYYWLKLKKDFFKRHDIKILEAMPDGHVSVLFYLKLMLESIDHDGELRFSEEVPYTPEMLAIITDTNLDVVNESLKRLQDLKLLEIAQDGTIVIDKVKSMTGFETEWAKKKREWREKQGQKEDKEGQCEDNVLDVSSQCPIRDRVRDRVRDRDIDIEKRNVKEKRTIFVPPTVEEVSQFCSENNIDVNANTFVNFYESKGWFVGKNKMKNWKAAVRTWERNNARRYDNTQPRLVSGNPFDGIE